jgi:hypothetical protein
VETSPRIVCERGGETVKEECGGMTYQIKPIRACAQSLMHSTLPLRPEDGDDLFGIVPDTRVQIVLVSTSHIDSKKLRS